MKVATRLSSPKSRQFIAWEWAKKRPRPVGGLSDFVPAGLGDRSQAIYCLEHRKPCDPVPYVRADRNQGSVLRLGGVNKVMEYKSGSPERFYPCECISHPI